MRIGGKIIVSDTGESRYGVLEDALREGLKAKRIDVLILGHAHDDHARNAAELLRKWQVGRVVMNESLWWEGTASNRAVRTALREEPKLERSFPDAGQSFDWGGAEWIFVNPPAGEFLDASSRPPVTRRWHTCCGSTVSQPCSRGHRAARREAGREDPRPRGRQTGRHLPRNPSRLQGRFDRRDPGRDSPTLGGPLSTGTNRYEHPSLGRSAGSRPPAPRSGARTQTAASPPASQPEAN